MRKTPELEEEVQRIRDRRQQMEHAAASSDGYSEDEAGPQEKPAESRQYKEESEQEEKADLFYEVTKQSEKQDEQKSQEAAARN